MKSNKPASLGKTVEIKATNRPIKIAYLVPIDDTPDTHMNLDAVFFESYTRWAGVFTLIIPTKFDDFLFDGYKEWLQHYDPDFIYSYVDLDIAFVEKIDSLCCPIAFLQHKRRSQENGETHWRSFLPKWNHYVKPISSISSVQSPASYSELPHEKRSQEPTIFTQFELADRFLADNFGCRFDTNSTSQPIAGFFKTLCLAADNISKDISVGTERCFSSLDAFRAISDCKVTPIARLAMANSTSIFHPHSIKWSSSFRLFIGNAPLDRINFWNSRHFRNSGSYFSNALILNPTLFEDEQFTKQLGQYLNNHNFLRSSPSSGPYRVELYSSNLQVVDLNTLRDKLSPHTWNNVNTSNAFNAPLIPSQQDLVTVRQSTSIDSATLKLNEDSNRIVADEPNHFIYIPPQLRGLIHGQWVVELNIERHNNLSQYSNVVETWLLPRRRKVTCAFTKQLAKPTLYGRLALIPDTDRFSFINNTPNRLNYEIFLPSDENFFRRLVLKNSQYPDEDLRASISKIGYMNIAISDKGQNFRGVISLFGSLSTAFNILTKKFWRDVLEEAKEDTTEPLTFTLKELENFIPGIQNHTETFQRLSKELDVKSPRDVKRYLRGSLKDTLEYLVQSNIFYQVAHWRCKYCGHLNSRSFDNMKIKNTCDICATEYLAPIDIEWKYELNNFVYRSIQKHSGFTVLWALGLLHQLHESSFWYLPEVDLHENDGPENKNEIDILCMVDGKFYAVEAKRSVSILLNNDRAIDKFVKVIKLLRPDVALLAFDRYCIETEDMQTMKTRLEEAKKNISTQIEPWTKLEVRIAQDDSIFSDFSVDLGWHGPRVSDFQLKENQCHPAIKNIEL